MWTPIIHIYIYFVVSISTLLQHDVQVSFILLWVKSENNSILIDSACFLNCVCVWNVALFRHHFEMAIWSAAKLKEVLFSSSLICWNRSLLKQSKCWIVEIISKCNRIISTEYPSLQSEEGVARFSEYGQETVLTPGAGPGVSSLSLVQALWSPAAAPPRQLANFAHVCLLMVLVLLITHCFLDVSLKSQDEAGVIM